MISKKGLGAASERRMVGEIESGRNDRALLVVFIHPGDAGVAER